MHATGHCDIHETLLRYLIRQCARVTYQNLRVRASRKTLIYLILTLNHCYPDYDFSLLRAHHFRKEPGISSVEEAVDSHLLEVSRVGATGQSHFCHAFQG